MNRIMGVKGQCLPWEGSNLARQRRKKLGVFRRLVL
jgi:hypothetical protein